MSSTGPLVSKPIKVGIIGLSSRGWASAILAPTILNHPSYELVALSTTNPTSAAEAAKKYSTESGKVVRGYHSAADLANDPEIDMIIVSVKPPFHKDAAIPALQSGKGMFFIEWPAGLNTEETKTFARLAKENNVRSMVGLQTQHSVFIRKVKEIIESGQIGEIKATNFVSTTICVLEGR